MNNTSVTITQCANGFQLLVESGQGEYLADMYIATVIEKSPYSYGTHMVSVVDVLKEIFAPKPVAEYDPLSDRPETVKLQESVGT
jgi:hypothetical protein